LQITVKSAKVGKTGTSDKGDWELIVIKAEDGTDYTTFHKSAKNLTPGTVIDIGEPTIKNGKCSFKEFNVISQGSPATSTSANGKNGMTPEDWAKKDRIERASYEAQTAFKGVIELLVAKVILPEGEIAKSALDWAAKKLIPGVPEQVARMPGLVKDPPTETDKEFEKLGEEPTFKNVGEFLTRVTKELGINRVEVLTRLSINDVKEIDSLEEAWATLTGKEAPKITEGFTPEDIPFS